MNELSALLPRDDSPRTPHPDVAAFADSRLAARHLFAGTPAIHEHLDLYLPKHEAELPQDRDARGRFTEVYNGFGRTIAAIAGLVFQKPPALGDDIAPAIKEQYEAIDVRGTHGDVFLRDAFVDASVTGYGGFLIEFPRVTGPVSRLQSRTLRPYWSYVPAEDIISWRTGTLDGERVFTQLVLQEKRLVPVGNYGSERQTVYRIYRHDLAARRISVQIVRIDMKEGRETIVEVEPEAPLVGPSKIPFEPFQLGAAVGDIVARPPLLDLVEVNLAHYRVSADRRWLMHLCCVPVPWARGLMPNPDGTSPTLAVGPNVLIKLNEGGQFGWAEPSGTAFAPTADEIERLENRMATLGLAFLQRDTRAAETAEARRLDGASQNSTVADVARRFEDAVERALIFHAEFLRVDVRAGNTDSGGSFSLNRDYETTVLPDSTLALLSGMEEKKQLTLATLWKLMERGKLLPDGFDPEDEKAQLDLERDLNDVGTDADDDEPPTPPKTEPAAS